MRSLKFRAWDESLKQYFYDVAVYPNNIAAIQRHNIESMVLEANGATHWTELDENSVIEQYTGLKDKNGKEIYEGDIVRIDSMDELRVGYVDLVADQYCIVCGEDEEGHKIVAEFYYYSKPEENCEVIGNIHENPELLGKEKE